ncbi:disulfide bond formation protein DsbA [Sulfitobacter sp. HGT1]|uniref:disulfide bond formation protein DsbA n=1 Tax=Sulfitobacter sp. HGT1 TaxID=2735435 RepID=UPI001594A6B1|nr:disulfide bond formation protein DsbA [Sulfitobacter sp. HGT1]
MRLILLLCAAAFPAAAQTDFTALTPAERAAFNAEMRGFLMAEPEVLSSAMTPPDYATAGYQDEAAADIALLRALEDQVLQGANIAIFTAPDCPTCDQALQELQALSDSSDATFTHHNMSSLDGAALSSKLGMVEAPFYVMPDMILRGHMPDIVLRKYLTR